MPKHFYPDEKLRRKVLPFKVLKVRYFQVLKSFVTLMIISPLQRGATTKWWHQFLEGRLRGPGHSLFQSIPSFFTPTQAIMPEFRTVALHNKCRFIWNGRKFTANQYGGFR